MSSLTKQPSVTEPSAGFRGEEFLERIRVPLSDLGIEAVTIRPLVPLKTHVTDDPWKLLLSDRLGRPEAVVHWAPADEPGIVATGVARSKQAVELLGAELGSAVLVPELDGWIDGRSYSVTAWHRPMTRKRIVGRLVKYWVAPSLLEWLHRATAHTRRPLTDEQLATLDRSLDTLAEMTEVRQDLRFAARETQERLGSTFQPWRVLAHNDLWEGNVLLPNARRRGSPSAGFYLIDWAGSLVDGMPTWDLLRICDSLRLPGFAVRRAVRRHRESLDWSAQDVMDGVVSAMAHLALHRGQMPMDRFQAGCAWAYDTIRAAT